MHGQKGRILTVDQLISLIVEKDKYLKMLENSKKDLNETIEKINKEKNIIENELGEMKWERLDDKVTCRISQAKDVSYLQEDEWSEIFDFFIKTTEEFIATFSKVAVKYKK